MLVAYYSYVSDKRKHRGSHPKDAELFAAAKLPDLREAVADLSWLLSRRYAPPSSQKVVGDRYDLTRRQRVAVARSACSDAALSDRLAKRVGIAALSGVAVAVDGYNLLITIESALAGGLILVGRDSTYRDLASIHGSYRTMAETIPALELIGRELAAAGVADALWLLDSPVSNSGRLRAKMLELAATHDWPWSVELHYSPDKVLIDSDRIVVTSDSIVLDGCRRWTNLARYIVDTSVEGAWIVDTASVECRTGNAEL